MSERLNKYISTSPGFQYSINVKYDLKSLTKVANYIPLAQTTSVITDVISSNKGLGTLRSRLIVGNYGTGKSHLSVVLLSIMGKVLSIESYNELLRKIEEYDKEAAHAIGSELLKEKMLPVVVTGSDQPFEQMLLASLQCSLEEAGLNSLMPSTSYSAALDQISIWKGQYPDAYSNLTQYLLDNDINISKLTQGLESLNKKAYNIFTLAYNYVTHGAVFQPLLKGKVEDIYLEVARQMSKQNSKGNSKYRGIFVLFDEFGKYLETAWENKETLNLQPLQDFAEACNSSAEHPIQFILVTHKPIAQYASKYGQDLVNEWKKVEGRFKNIELVNQPTKVYEIISNVILKDKVYWKSLQDDKKLRTNELRTQLINTRLFSDLTLEELDKYILNGSFPLHPVLVFALPRFSQKVAQNERTVFTFLCSNEFNTLSEFLNNNDADSRMLLTLDVLYDYFENQMRTIDGQDNIHKIWFETNAALSRLGENELLEARILKSISVIKTIGLPTVLPATIDTLKLTYSGSDIELEKLVSSFQTLLRKRILFEGSSTGILEFIVPGEMDIEQEVSVLVAKRRTLADPLSVLNDAFLPNTVLAKRYNDDFSMVRYFSCHYVSVKNLDNLVYNEFEGHYGKDGMILCVLPKDEGDIVKFKETLTSLSAERIVFVVPENGVTDYQELELLIRKLDALKELLKVLESGKHLEADRLEILLRFRDAETKINIIISRTFNLKRASVYHHGNQLSNINCKSDLSRLISNLCSEYFKETPKFNNEMINKHNLTAPIIKARQKVVNGLLSQFMLPTLGIIGSGPELAIFKCLLAHPGIVVEDEQNVELADLQTLKDKGLISTLLKLKSLLTGATEGLSVDQILRVLCNPPYGVRRGVVPILLAIVLREQKKEVLLIDSKGKEVPLNAENIDIAIKDPKGYLLLKENWSQEKTLMCNELEIILKEYMDEDSSLSGTTKQIADAFRRWLFSIPRFTRDSKGLTQGAKTLRKLLKSENLTSTKLIFHELPNLFGVQSLTCENVISVISRLSTLKSEIDGYLSATIVNLEQDLVQLVELGTINSPTLLASLKTWYELLPSQKRNNLYSDGTQNLIDLVSSFAGENSIDFSNRLFINLTGLRPEDWNDQSVKGVPQILKDMLYEVTSFEYILRQEGDISAATEVEITFPQDNGTSIKRIFSKGSVSQTGNLLQNVLWSYITEYGDSVTNNEKRQIVLTILEKLVKS